MRPHQKIPRFWWWLIVLLAGLAWQPALHDTYTLDDVMQVRDFPVPQTSSAWLHAAAEPWWRPDIPHSLWRPVPRMSILLQKAIHPSHEWPFHAFNIALIILASWLLMLVAVRIGFSPPAAGLAALIFAIHPLHSEAIHQIVGRAESLAAVFMLLGIYLLQRSGFPAERPAWWQLPSQALCFALALGSKESAVIYPVYALLLALANRPNFCPNFRRNAPSLLLLLFLLSATAALFFYLRFRVTGGFLVSHAETSWIDNPIYNWSFLQRLPAVFGIFAFALLHFFWPLGLSPDYGSISLPITEGWRWPFAPLGALFALLILIYIMNNFRRRSSGYLLVLAGLAAYGITSNLLFPIGVAVAERIWFWPLAVPCLAAAYYITAASQRLAQNASPAQAPRRKSLPAIALAVLLLAATWNYAPAWRDTEARGNWVLDRFPQNTRAMLDISVAAVEQRDFETGYEYARRAARIHPTGEALDLIGVNAGAFRERRAEAEQAYKAALLLDPNNNDVHYHWGLLLQVEGRTTEALQKYRTYLTHPYTPWRAEVEERIRSLQK